MATKTTTINHRDGITIKVTVTKDVYQDTRTVEGMELDYGRKLIDETHIVVADSNGKIVAVGSGIRHLNRFDPKHAGVVGALVSNRKVWLTAELYTKLEQALAEMESEATSPEYIALQLEQEAMAAASLANAIEYERTHGEFNRKMDAANSDL